MKKFFLVPLFVLALSLSANSQDFKPFRLDAGAGYGIPFPEGLNGGLLFYVEPKYEIAPQISVGIRWEGSLFGGAEEGVSIKLSAGYMATGDYYFNNESFRPFVGIGAGVFAVGGMDIEEEGETIKGEGATNFAAMARVGFDYSHFRLTASYNHAFTEGKAFNFIALTVGFYIGGGKR